MHWETKHVHVCVCVCVCVCANLLPRRLDSVPVPVMNGVMWVLDPPHTWTHVPEEIHFPFAHLQG